MIELMIFIWVIGCMVALGMEEYRISKAGALMIIGIVMAYFLIWPLLLGQAISEMSSKE